MGYSSRPDEFVQFCHGSRCCALMNHFQASTGMIDAVKCPESKILENILSLQKEKSNLRTDKNPISSQADEVIIQSSLAQMLGWSKNYLDTSLHLQYSSYQSDSYTLSVLRLLNHFLRFQRTNHFTRTAQCLWIFTSDTRFRWSYWLWAITRASKEPGSSAIVHAGFDKALNKIMC